MSLHWMSKRFVPRSLHCLGALASSSGGWYEHLCPNIKSHEFKKQVDWCPSRPYYGIGPHLLQDRLMFRVKKVLTSGRDHVFPCCVINSEMLRPHPHSCCLVQSESVFEMPKRHCLRIDLICTWNHATHSKNWSFVVSLKAHFEWQPGSSGLCAVHAAELCALWFLQRCAGTGQLKRIVHTCHVSLQWDTSYQKLHSWWFAALWDTEQMTERALSLNLELLVCCLSPLAKFPTILIRW